MATKEQVFEFARQEAIRQGVSPDLVVNIVRAESSGRTDAVSNKGARGPMQLMPATAKELGVDINNWQDNIRGGVRYINQMLNQFGDPVLAVAAYNAGPGNVRRAGGVPNFKETQDYVQKVLGTNMATQETRSGTRRIDPSVLGIEATGQQPAQQQAPQQPAGPRRIDPSVLAAVPEQTPVQAQAPSTSITDTLRNVGRQIALTTRYGLEGAGQVLDIGGAPIASLINAVTGTQEALPPSQAISRGLTQFGFPEPQGRMEQTVGNITRTGLGALTGVGAGQALARGAPLVQGQATATQAVGQGLATQPTAQLAGAATGQAGIELAQQQFDVQNPLALAGIGLISGAPAAAVTARAGNVPSGTQYRDPVSGQLIEAGRARGVNVTAADVGGGGQTLQTLRAVGGTIEEAATQRGQEQTQLISRTVANAKPAAVGRGNEAKVVAQDMRSQYNTAKRNVSPLFQNAEKLAGDQRIATPNSMQAVADVLDNFPVTAETERLRRNIDRIEKYAGTGATYKQLRDVQKVVGNEMAKVQKGLGPGGAYSNDQYAAITRLYSSLDDDVNAWAAPRQINGRPVYTPAGAAHERAMEQFRQTVAPFRQDPDIYRLVSSRTFGDDYDRAAETFANKLTNNTATADLAMDLMSDKGQRAAQYSVLNDAQSAAFRQGTAEPDIGAFNSRLNLGILDNPTPQRVILSRNPSLLDEVSTVTDVLNTTRTPQGQTQSALIPFAPTAGRTVTGGAASALGATAGLDPMASGAIGLTAGLLAPGVARRAEQALTSLPATRFMLGQPNMGTAGATSILGGQMPSLYDLLSQ
jgi:hypothetical protein